MFCSKCGTEIPDDSQFCRKCGTALTTATATTAYGAAPAPAPRKPKTIRLAFVLGLLLVLAVCGWIIDHSIHHQEAESARDTPEVNLPVLPVVHTVDIGKGALSVGAMQYSYYRLEVPAGAHNVKVRGHFTATGGGGNDIEVFLLGGDEFTNWRNGHGTHAYYNSGKVTVGDVQAELPDVAGTYYLIFNNNFSLLTPKAVEFAGTITYYQ